MEPKSRVIKAEYIANVAKFFAELSESNAEQAKHFEEILPDVADWHKSRAEAYELCAAQLIAYVEDFSTQVHGEPL